jgi:hypothetical protein
MQSTKARIDGWLSFWDGLFLKIALVCGSSALIFLTGNLLTQGLFASRVFLWLFAVACTTVILFAAAYAVLVGLSIYYERRRQTTLMAVCGFSTGLLFGIFFAFLAFAGLIAVSIS